MNIKYITLSILSLFLINSCAEPFTLETKWGQFKIDNNGKINGFYTPKIEKPVDSYK